MLYPFLSVEFLCFPQNMHTRISYVLSDVIFPRVYQLSRQRTIIISIALIQTRTSFLRKLEGTSKF